MIRAAYSRLLWTALGVTFVSYPAIQPVLSSDASYASHGQAFTSNANDTALEPLAPNRIFALGLKHQPHYHDAIPDVGRKEIGAINRIEMQKAMPRQEISGLMHPVHRVAARNGRAIYESNALLLSDPPLITNIESFSGPNYGSVIIDLSWTASYIAKRADSKQILIRVIKAVISPSLDQQVFTLGEAGLIKQIFLSGAEKRYATRATGVDVVIDVASTSDYSVRRLPDSSRILIELRSQDSQGGSHSPENQVTSAGSSSACEPLEYEQVRPYDEQQLPNSSQDIDESRTSEKRLVSLHVENRISIPYQIDNSIKHSLSPISDKTIDDTFQEIKRLPDALESKPSERPIKCIVIDAGHGGHDPGAISPNGILEKELVLDIARRLKAYITARYPHCDVVLTRESDYFITLDQRVKIANSRSADLFLSIHANASESPAASGVETYYSRPNGESPRTPQAAGEAGNRFGTNNLEGYEASDVSPRTASLSTRGRLEESEELARHLQAALVRGTGSAPQPNARDRGVKPALFTVLLGTKMPSVLAEISFLSNRRDAELLRSEQYRDRIATALLSGLNEYLANAPGESSKNRK